MSIYDQIPDRPQDASARPGTTKSIPPTPPKKSPPKKRSGCATCFVVMLGLMFICILACGFGTWFVIKKSPDWAGNMIASAIEGSNLTDEDKRIVTEQIDRVVDEYKSGRVTMQQLAEIAEEFSQSPLLTLTMAMATEEAYIKPSGLPKAEKELASRTLQRTARGVFEDNIDTEELNTALDFISTESTDGTRQFKSPVADSELRQMLAECKRLADEAAIPDEPYQVDVGAEFKATIDRVLIP